MKVFSCIVKDGRGHSEIGYIVAEDIKAVMEIAPGRLTSCTEMGELIAIQGTIEVKPQIVETTRKPRGNWLDISRRR